MKRISILILLTEDLVMHELKRSESKCLEPLVILLLQRRVVHMAINSPEKFADTLLLQQLFGLLQHNVHLFFQKIIVRANEFFLLFR